MASTSVSVTLTRYDAFLLCDLYSSSGRGYPDVASQFYNLSIVQNGYFIFEHGPTATVRLSVPPFSLVCPSSSTKLTVSMQTFGAIISLLDDFLLSQNLPVLGFLNPWLYGQGQAGLNDITYGSNPGCNTEGFLAVPGWDAVRSTRLCAFPLSMLADSGLNRSQVSGPQTSSNCREHSPTDDIIDMDRKILLCMSLYSHK